LIAGVVALGIVGGGAVGLRSYLRAQKVKDCEAGRGEALLDACRVACETEPKKHCATHGDLAREKLDRPSVEEAHWSYDRGCAAEDFVACRKLGALQEVKEKDDAAVESYQRSCEGKSASGCGYLARMLERGRGVPRDLPRALSLYEGACVRDPVSCAFQSLASDNRPPPRPEPSEVARLVARAAPELHKECRTGGLIECLTLGCLRQQGLGVERDLAGAGALYKKACDGGLREACNNASVLSLADGPKDAAPAVEALRGACAGGLAVACNNLAVLEAGTPFVIRQDQGSDVLRVACGEGLTLGCADARVALPAPADPPKDLANAVTRLGQTCARGVGVACANLGTLQENGLGAGRDRAEAQASYAKGCAAGAAGACAVPGPSPFVKGEAWAGSYVCSQGPTDVVLRVVEAGADLRVAVIFDLDYAHGQVVGRFFASGAYDAGRGTIAFTPGAWLEQPRGWRAVPLHGQVSVLGTVFTGEVESPTCGAIRVTRLVSDAVSSQCSPQDRFVEGHGCVPVPRGPLDRTALGHWTGTGTQPSGSSWIIDAHVMNLESGHCGHVRYPTLACEGDWYCLKSTDGKTLRAREIITTPKSRCDTTGTIEMTVSDDGQRADWRWSTPGRAGTDSARLARALPP